MKNYKVKIIYKRFHSIDHGIDWYQSVSIYVVLNDSRLV